MITNHERELWSSIVIRHRQATQKYFNNGGSEESLLFFRMSHGRQDVFAGNSRDTSGITVLKIKR